mmetsp:Transcript_13765/g.20290  ORF Transcript_13765/g.20290 Transcript_13765/m.20290 type:complete len:290 (-) Transcript_13765:3545-4414(-)
MNKVTSRILLGMGSCAVAAGFTKSMLPSSSWQSYLFHKSARMMHHSQENLPQHVVLPKIEDEHRQGILVVGDVHGCLDELKELHEVAIKENNGMDFQFVILVGDLVNKGPFSAEVVQYIQEKQNSGNNWLAVRGNHDNGAIAAAKGDEKRRQNPTYRDWVHKLTVKDISWLESLPYTIRIPKSFWEKETEHEILVVHAGLIPGIPLVEQTVETMVTIRDVESKPWASVWNGPEHIIFGHDARRGIQREKFATGLDSGACYGKRLTGILLPQRVLVNVSSRREYEEVSGN